MKACFLMLFYKLELWNKLKINYFYKNIYLYILYMYIILVYFIWGLGIGDWGLGIGDWAQSPIPILINLDSIYIINYLNA